MDLSEDNLHFLAQRAFQTEYVLDYENRSLSWVEFNKNYLPNCEFTFWEWFYAIIRVLREDLAAFWAENKIAGFISKQNSMKLLSYTSPGTFLLRFAESELGSISISLSTNEGVFTLRPINLKNLHEKGLANCLHELPMLKTLYPNDSKDIAFCVNDTTLEIKNKENYLTWYYYN